MLRNLFITLAGILFLLALGALPVIGPLLNSTQKEQAAVAIPNPLGSTPFGGRIISVKRCTCDFLFSTKLVIVGPPKGGEFIVFGGGLFGVGSELTGTKTKLYDYKKVDAGNWVLGLGKGPPIPCESICKSGCCTQGIGPRISFMGTSDSSGGIIPAIP